MGIQDSEGMRAAACSQARQCMSVIPALERPGHEEFEVNLGNIKFKASLNL